MVTTKRLKLVNILFAATAAAILLDPPTATATDFSTTDYDCPQNASAKSREACQIDGDAYYNYFAKGDYDRAIQEFSRAIALDPNIFILYLNRGNSYSQRGYINKQPGDYALAIADYKMGLTLAPHSSSLYNGLGLAYYRSGNLQLALTAFNTALQIDPKFSSAYFNRGNLFWDLKNYDQAVNDFTSITNLDSDTDIKANAYFSRGEVYETIARDFAKQNAPGPAALYYKNAENDFQSALQLNPGFVEAQKALENVQIAINGGDFLLPFRKFTPGFPVPSR